MTDRIKGFYVALENDTREDDALPIMKAVGQLRGVLSVEPNISDVDDWIAENRAKAAMAVRLWDALYNKETGLIKI